jgi:hypothetical protein
LDGGSLDTPLECHDTIRTSNEITNAVPEIGQVKRPTETVPVGALGYGSPSRAVWSREPDSNRTA